MFFLRYELNLNNVFGSTIKQGEAAYKKYKRLKFCGGQAYDRSSD
jgi:hypothetical protein